ncbi:hypothetical protein FRB95_001148 [Tulasnella sp. JGI-2019a]|nr:hypothetical protein FRB95_001148 [Tulasnella sp. JGI-2019a]
MSDDPRRAGDMNAQTELLTFNGSDTSDVTLFLQNVKRVAFAQGRQRDDEWLVDYTEISLTGVALRWFHQLDQETARSWRALCDAFLLRFGSTAQAPAPTAAPVPRSNVQHLPSVILPNEIPPDPSQIVLKILLLGDPGVGKSSVLARFLGRWNPALLPTIGVLYETQREKRGGRYFTVHTVGSSCVCSLQLARVLRLIRCRSVGLLWRPAIPGHSKCLPPGDQSLMDRVRHHKSYIFRKCAHLVSKRSGGWI